MELATVVLEALVTLGSGAAGALVTAYRLGATMKEAADTAKRAHERAEALERDLESFRNAEAEQWQVMNRALGVLEGMLSVSPTRDPRRSRPGPV